MKTQTPDSPLCPAWRGSRRQLLGAATVWAGAVFAGCAPRGGVPGARVTLTQWYHQYGETGTQQAVLRYAQDYHRLHPDVAVQIAWVPGDYGTKLSTALLTAGGPDVFEGQVTAAMVGAGQVAPLDDLFPPDVRADFTPRDLAANTVGGKIYGVKTLDDTGILYYRPSLLQAANVAPPATLGALLQAAKALTTPARKGLFIGNDGGVAALINIAPWSAGSDFLVDDRIVFDNPRTVAAYEGLRALGDSGALLIGAPTDWWDPSALVQGLAAMQWGGLWAYPAIHRALGGDVGGMAWPALDAAGQPSTFLGGWAAMVNAQGPNIDEAKKYVRWLWIENKKAQTDWCLSYGFHVPPRISVARQAAALRAPVAAQAAHDVAAYGRALPPVWNAAMGTALTDAVTNIVKLGRPAAPEVAQAAGRCRRELGRALE